MARLLQMSRIAGAALLLGALAAGPAAAQNTAPSAAPPGAFAPLPTNPVIAVVDIDRIMRESMAARGVHDEGDKYQKQLGELNSKAEAQLRQVQQTLEQQRKTLSQDAFADKYREFEQQYNDLQRLELKRRQAFDRSFSAAMSKVQQAMVDATHDIALQRRANVVLVRQLVLFFDDRMDITGQIIDVMNQRLPSVEFPPPKIEPDEQAAGANANQPPAKLKLQ